MTTLSRVNVAFQELPEGTVTFLFTDIEGSTQLLHQLRDQYATLLEEHHQVIREAIDRWHGREVDTQGDAFFVAFPKATEAIAAAAEIQRTLNEHTWPEDVQVRVRMGLHTGEPWLAGEGYVGMDVHRAARIAHVGHGGQVLLSETTAALVMDELPDGVSLLDLGRHLLKDMHRPEHIRQLDIAGLPGKFPPLTSLATVPDASDRPAREVGDCPYRGLAAFREADAPFYYGREAFVDTLEQAIGQQPMVAVIVGSSGSGKSSAIFAGLLPRLRQEAGWTVATLRPGAQPFHALAGTLLPYLESGLSESERLIESGKLAKGLIKGDTNLVNILDRILEKEESTQRLLIVLDQFEELYTLCPDEELQHQLVDQLLAVVDASQNRGQLSEILLLTLRADFMGQALAYRPFADALQEASLLMGPMNREELRSAVERPAEKQGAAFEPGLVERILDDVGDKPGNLPLLEFTLTQLWQAQDDGWLAHDDYEALGGVEGALASYAEDVYGELSAEQQDGARRSLIQMVRPGEGTEDTRRVATRQELGGKNWDLVRHLADKRLVVTGQDAQGRQIAEVVHEALIQRWDRFREWMESDRAFRAWQERLRANLQQWQESDEDQGALLNGAPLTLAMQWLRERELDLSQQESAFIVASHTCQEQRQAQRERRRRRTILALAAGLILTVGLASLAYYQRQNSLQQAAILLAGQAESELADGYHDRAVLLALEALEQFPYTAQAERALGQAVLSNRALQQYDEHQSAATGAAWSPDGTRIATSASSDNSVHIWDPDSGEAILIIELPTGITGNILDMALNVLWTPDGERLVVMAGDRYQVGSQDYDLLLFDARNGELLSSIDIPNQAEAGSGDITASFVTYSTGSAAAIAPNSGRLATLGGDNTALIWDGDWQLPEIILRGHMDAVNSVAWSPDGTELLTAGMDGTARVWDANSGQERLSLEGHLGRVTYASWSPDGDLMATSGEDGTIRIWQASDGSPVRIIPAGTETVWSFAWSRDGQLLASGHEEGQVVLWEVASGKLLVTLAGHQGFVSHLAWSPSDDRLASTDNSGFVRIWNATSSTAWRTFPIFYAQGLDWTQDSRYLAIAGGDIVSELEPPSFSIWDVVANQVVVDDLASELNQYGTTIFFAPDDKSILFSGAGPFPEFAGGETEYLLDPWTGEFLQSFTVDETKSIRNTNWSPDGSKIVVGAFFSNEVWIFDAQTGELLEELIPPGYSDQFGYNFVDWSPDGSKIAAAKFDSIAPVWDANSGELLYIIDGHEPPTEVWCVSFSPDGSRLLTTSGSDEGGAKDHTARIWDAETGEELLILSGHTKSIQFGFWSPDGQRIVTASTDNTVRIWDATTGDELLRISPPPALYGILPSWSPDGRYIATSGLGSQASVWHVWESKEELVDFARECCVFRELTVDERDRFGLGGE